MINNILLQKEILSNHLEDKSQINILKSRKKRILVEAPAGYGKTHTLISKLKLWINDPKFNYNKKILCLSFSVNAAQNISDRIDKDLDSDTKRYVKVGNYHSLAITILSKYGKILNPSLKKEKQYKIVGQNYKEINSILNEDEKIFYKNFKKEVRNSSLSENSIIQFNSIVLNKFLPNNFLTYDSILTLAIQLLDQYEEIKKFYSKYFSHIVIDEFQDTNILQYEFLTRIISSNSYLLFLGDTLQRVYGFIGAIPDIMNKAKNHFDLSLYSLEQNYRFESASLKLLDKNLRENIKKMENEGELNSFCVIENAKIKTIHAVDTLSQADNINRIVRYYIKYNPDKKIGILFRNNNYNTNLIKNRFNFQYFDGLYNENDFDDFQEVCAYIFIENYSTDKFKKNDINSFIDLVSYEYKVKFKVNCNETFTKLLGAFLNNVIKNRKMHSYRNKIILETFINKYLKNYLNYIDDHVTLTTIHSSKGLEWDLVIMPDLIQNVFPNYFFVNYNPSPQDKMDEMCIFYVGISRCKSSLIFSYADSYKIFSDKSNEEFTINGEISDLLLLHGIELDIIS